MSATNSDAMDVVYSNDSTRSALSSLVAISFQNVCLLDGMSGVSLLTMAVFLAVGMPRGPSRSSASVTFSRNVFFRKSNYV